MKASFTIPFLLFALFSFGQTEDNVEKDLLNQFKKIAYWQGYKGDNGSVSKEDSLGNANENFRQNLLNYASQNPVTIKFAFKDLQQAGLTVATSEDGLFRIYSWDTGEGGTMHFFENVHQYKIGNKVFSRSIHETNKDDEPDYWYSHVYSLMSGNQTYYLVVRHAIYSNKDAYQGIKVYRIVDNLLVNDAKLFKTKSGIRNTLGFGFNFFSVVDRKERPVRLINYNQKAKTISIPVVTENGTVTNKLIVYRFTGEYFERNNNTR